MRRSKCVRNSSPKKVMSYSEFNNRIRKTFYYGGSNLCDDDMEVSRPLAEYASDLFSEPHKGHSLNRLNTIAASSVHATPCSLIMALIYLDRLNITDPCYARRITPQELFIVSMMISTKFYAGHDEEFYMSDWAEDGNMTEERLKQLELEFLNAIEWNIYISNEQFFKKLDTIEKTIARREGLRRGWLTYTELTQLLPSFTLAKFLFNNFSLLAMSYAASVITLAGAFFLASQIPNNTFTGKTTRQTNTTTLLTPTRTEQLGTPAAGVTTTTAETGNDTRLRNTHEPAEQIYGTIDTTLSMATSTCLALNIEAELLKLEYQYLEEARLADLRKRHHEIATDSRLSLPGGAQCCQYNANEQHVRLYEHDQQTNWRALQEEYSDDHEMTRQQYLLPEPTWKNYDAATAVEDYPCFNTWQNCTGSVLWHVLTDVAQRSFIRLPLVWFKFM